MVPLTEEFDSRSVMHYPIGDAGTTTFDITEFDRKGARSLYGPPDDEVSYYPK